MPKLTVLFARRIRLHAGLGAALLAVGLTAPSAGMPPQERLELEDRILAVVDEDPILDSDLERLVALGLVAPAPDESPEAFRRRVLDALIEQRLRFHAIERFGFEEVPVAAIDEEIAQIRGRFEDEAAFRDELKRLGLSEKGLRQLLSRQLMVLTYIEERLGPRIFIRDQDIQAYYRQVLVPELGGDAAVPPIDEVRESIRRVLRERRLNEEIAKWSDELRDKADIRIYAEPPRSLPPPVGRPAARQPGGGG